MASDEQFSLCWNNFHSNMSTGFHGLLSRGDLVDVTLAAEGRLLQAHKLVLSVCSPYFQEMFKMNPTQHPIVFLKDVSYNALRDLLQFMYQGEVNVKQEELASFISTAEQLQVKGLTGNQSDDNSLPASKPKPSSRPGPRSSQQRQSVNKQETDIESKTITPVALKRPNRPSVTPSNPQSSQPAPAKRKCVDPLEAGPSGTNSKDEFVTIPDDEEPSAVAPKMEPEFVNESLWDDDDDGANNDEGNFGEDDSNMEMSGFGDGSVTGDTTIAGATGEGGAVGDAQVVKFEASQRGSTFVRYQNHKFIFDSRSKRGLTRWYCSKRRSGCKARLHLMEGDIVRCNSDHTHPLDVISVRNAFNTNSEESTNSVNGISFASINSVSRINVDYSNIAYDSDTSRADTSNTNVNNVSYINLADVSQIKINDMLCDDVDKNNETYVNTFPPIQIKNEPNFNDITDSNFSSVINYPEFTVLPETRNACSGKNVPYSYIDFS